MLIPLQTTLVLNPRIRMKTLLFLLFLAPLLSAQKTPAARKPAAAADDWVLTFADEFEGKDLDLSRWIPHAPLDTRPIASDSLRLSGGQLHLSGTVSTFGMFAQMYGRFEIRFSRPEGQMSHARFLLAPVPAGKLPEIDIFESAGKPDRVLFANRWGNEQTERSFSDSFEAPDLTKGFHTIAIEWERNRIAWFIDGKATFESVEGVPQQPMCLVIEMKDHNEPGRSPLDIDYVRVYERPKVK